MQNHSENSTKSKSAAYHNFWQPLVKKIYACNMGGIFPDNDGVYAAFVNLQRARPKVGFEISYKQESRGYRERDETLAICISKSFGGRGSISLTVNCEAEFLNIHFFARSLNYRRIHRRNGFQHSKILRTNPGFAMYLETNGKLLERNFEMLLPGSLQQEITNFFYLALFFSHAISISVLGMSISSIRFPSNSRLKNKQLGNARTR